MKTLIWISDDNSDENEALEFGSDDYGSDGSQDEEDVSYFNSRSLIICHKYDSHLFQVYSISYLFL